MARGLPQGRHLVGVPGDCSDPARLAGEVAERMVKLGLASLHELHAGGRLDDPRRLDMSYDRLGKLLRGQAAMTVRHVADLERRFGPLLVGLKMDLAPWEKAPAERS